MKTQVGATSSDLMALLCVFADTGRPEGLKGSEPNPVTILLGALRACGGVRSGCCLASCDD